MVGFEQPALRVIELDRQMPHLAEAREIELRRGAPAERRAPQLGVEKMDREVGGGLDLRAYVSARGTHQKRATGEKEDGEHEGDHQIESQLEAHGRRLASLGSADASHPPPSAFTSSTLAVRRWPRMPTAVRSLSSATLWTATTFR